MAFPTVQEVVENSTNSAGTNHVINHPTVVAGELWLILLDKGSTAATVNAHADWTELLDENSANGLYVAYRWTTGGEGASTTLVTSASTRTASFLYRISGAENPATQAPQLGTTASGSSATPDPPASATPASAKDYLFIAFYGAAGEEADDNTWSDTPPASYTPSPPRMKSCGTAGTNLGGLIAAAERQLNTGVAQNPGTFAKDVSAAWRAQTVMVHPVSLQSYTLTADAGSYAWTGTAAGLLAAYRAAAGAGAYAEAGTAATLVAARRVSAAGAVYDWTGSAATLSFGYRMAADAGSHAWAGQAAGLLAGLRVAAAAGAASVSGAAATLAAARALPGGGAAYALVGTAAGLSRTFVTQAGAGAVAWDGTAAGLLAAFRAAAAGGAVTAAGVAARAAFDTFPAGSASPVIVND